MTKKASWYLVFGFSAAFFAVGAVAFAAWVDAPAAPPGYGLSGCTPPCQQTDFQPVNLSTSAQTKAGDLGAGRFCLAGVCISDWTGGGSVGTNYWTQSGSLLYPNQTSWRLGVGTTNPGTTLEVVGTAGTEEARITGPDPRVNLNATGGAARQYLLQAIGSTGQFRIFDQTGAASRLTISNAGAVNVPGTFTVASQQVCRSDGSGGWLNCPAGNAGTVTSVDSGAGLTGGPITTSGTLSVNTTGISSCTGAGQKILWDSTNNRFTCGTDDTGAGGTVTGTGTAGRAAFWTSASALSSNANFAWDNTNSRLGIGAASPATALEVQGTGAGGGADEEIRVTGPDPRFALSTTAGPRQFLLQALGTSGGQFRIFDQTSAADRLTISSTGNVGVGLTTAGYKLDVAGDVNITGTYRVNGVPLSTGGITGSGTTNNIARWTPNGTTLGNSVIQDDGTNVGIGITPGSHRLTLDGAIYATSLQDNSGYSMDPSSISYINNLRVDTEINGFNVSGYGNDNLLLQTNGNNVGIGGTTNPQSRLTVARSGVNGFANSMAFISNNDESSYAGAISGLNAQAVRSHPSSAYGVYGYGYNSGIGSTVGIFGQAWSQGSGNSYGGYFSSTASGGGVGFAVYGEGNIASTRNIIRGSGVIFNGRISCTGGLSFATDFTCFSPTVTWYWDATTIPTDSVGTTIAGLANVNNAVCFALGGGNYTAFTRSTTTSTYAVLVDDAYRNVKWATSGPYYRLASVSCSYN